MKPLPPKSIPYFCTTCGSAHPPDTPSSRATCSGIGGSWRVGELIDAGPKVIGPLAAYVHKNASLTRAIEGAGPALRRLLRDALVSTVVRGAKGVRTRICGVEWMVRSTGVWEAYAGGEELARGDNLGSLAAAMSATSEGVFAVRVLDASLGKSVDAECARGIQREIMAWIGRGATSRGRGL